MAPPTEYGDVRRLAVSDAAPLLPESAAANAYATERYELIPDRLPVKNPIQALVNDLGSVRHGGRILIFCGEAHWFVYNSPEVLDVAERMHRERQAQIEVITGPILLVPDQRDQLNGLLILKRKGVISELFHRSARYATNHFRVVEADNFYHYYAEYPHPPLFPVEKRTCVNFDRLKPNEVHHQAIPAVALFESWKGQAIRHGAPGFEELPLIATSSGLETLLAEAKQRDLAFKYLDERELRRLPSGRQQLTPYPRYLDHLQTLVNGSNGDTR